MTQSGAADRTAAVIAAASVKSPTTASVPGGSEPGVRTSAATGRPRASSSAHTTLPRNPPAPVTSISALPSRAGGRLRRSLRGNPPVRSACPAAASRHRARPQVALVRRSGATSTCGRAPPTRPGGIRPAAQRGQIVALFVGGRLEAAHDLQESAAAVVTEQQRYIASDFGGRHPSSHTQGSHQSHEDTRQPTDFSHASPTIGCAKGSITHGR